MKYLFLLLMISFNSFALSVPKLTQPVVDLADILSNNEEERLNNLLFSLFNEGLIQVSVLIIPSLEGEVLEDYSIKVAQTWGLGSSIKDNGLLILMAMEERKIRVEVGQGIEGEVTDYLSSRIISKMGPYMRTKEYEEALTNAVRIVESAMRENTPQYREQIRQQEAQAEILKLELEKKRMQEQELEEKEYAEKMAKFKEVAEPVGAAILILISSFFIYASFQNDKKIELTATKIKEEKKKTRDIVAKVEEVKKQHSEMKVDPTKYQFVQLKEEVISLKNEKNKLASSISSMKSYLGVG
jgi:uncharacterized membrane protein YgcG